MVTPRLPGVLPEPPLDLRKAEAVYWRSVTATKPAEWWQDDAKILLKAYCRASVQHDRVSRLINRMPKRTVQTDEGWRRYESMVKLQATVTGELAMLATKMRLCPQSRYERKVAHTIDTKTQDQHPWRESQRKSA